jgi:monoamine oxidase
MAQELGAQTVQLESPVVHIKQPESGLVTVVYTSTGNSSTENEQQKEQKQQKEQLREIKAKRVILAMAPPLCSRIRFTPPLPPTRAQAQHRMPMGSVIKVNVLYKRAWWREKGFSGELISDIGPMGIAYDKSVPGVHGLLGFIAGKHARYWGQQTQQQRQQAVLQQIKRIFQSDEALRPEAYVDHNWAAEQWSEGCYMAVLQPGQIQAFGEAMSQPVGRLHFAGTETARGWMGYIDGALESGKRAAQEVQDALKSDAVQTVLLRSKL